MDSDSSRHVLQRREPGGLKHIEIRCLAMQQWIRDKRVGRVDTKNNTADIFTLYLEGRRMLLLSKKLRQRVTSEASEDALGEQRPSSSRCVSKLTSH